ncbi:Sortilin [Galemys pyrenaicus]|uniref:Sortilin n=1 Tax=Galemys pyrenaicus TaxID=202257 RepID=A0A8J5ZYF8_GALPY|nr:Sortilin [Galemys pyrenaicus]
MGEERPGCAYPRSAGLRLGGVARRRRGWAGAPGGRCQRRRHSAAMELPRGAAAGLSRGLRGLGVLLVLLQLLPPAALGQDRLDAPPPPAPPLSRWSGPVGVSWGLRAAAPGGPSHRGGRWRRSALDADKDCGGVRDFVARLANNTHQVSGSRAPAPPGLRGAAPGPGGRRPARAAGPPLSVRAPRVSAERLRRSGPRCARAPRAAAPELRRAESGRGRGPPLAAASAAVFRHRGGRRRLRPRSVLEVVRISRTPLFSVRVNNRDAVSRPHLDSGERLPLQPLGKLGRAEAKVCPLWAPTFRREPDVSTQMRDQLLSSLCDHVGYQQTCLPLSVFLPLPRPDLSVKHKAMTSVAELCAAEIPSCRYSLTSSCSRPLLLTASPLHPVLPGLMLPLNAARAELHLPAPVSPEQECRARRRVLTPPPRARHAVGAQRCWQSRRVCEGRDHRARLRVCLPPGAPEGNMELSTVKLPPTWLCRCQFFQHLLLV